LEDAVWDVGKAKAKVAVVVAEDVEVNYVNKR
jgi:hypothetical protein